MAHKHAFDAALEQMNRGNAAGPVLERIGDTDRMRCTVVGAEGCSEFFFDASDYLDLASRTYARDIPALVAHMLQYAKSFIAAPQGDAQSKLAAATRLATEEGPPPPSPPLARLRRPGSWFGPCLSMCAGHQSGASCAREDDRDCSRDRVGADQGKPRSADGAQGSRRNGAGQGAGERRATHEGA